MISFFVVVIFSFPSFSIFLHLFDIHWTPFYICSIPVRFKFFLRDWFQNLNRIEIPSSWFPIYIMHVLSNKTGFLIKITKSIDLLRYICSEKYKRTNVKGYADVKVLLIIIIWCYKTLFSIDLIQKKGVNIDPPPTHP